MGDVRCGWCEAPLPGPAVGRRYCRAAHQQAAWRARRRWRQAATAREGMTAAGEDLVFQVQALAQWVHELPSRCGCAGWHSASVARVPERAGQLVRAAVWANRQAGASWAQIGASSGISAEAARRRFGRTRGSTTPTARGG